MPKRGRILETLTDERKLRLETVIRKRQPDLTLVLENIWDPHNLSAIIRSADSVGILTVHLLYYIEKLPDLRRHGKLSSASANKWLEFRAHSSVADCAQALKAEGFRIYSSHLTEYSTSLYNIDGCEKIALVMGNENRGVSEELCRLSDGVYYIPMAGMVQSLNVSVAAAVSMYEMFRQRLTRGLYDGNALSEERVQELLKEWAGK